MHDWCQIVGIAPPKLEAVAGHREANTYALLLVALLERGAPMTLAEVATRFEEAAIATRARALLSLQRCKPARPPVYREGDRYHLDPHDEDLDLWVFRLGLRPPKVAPLPATVVEAAPRPDSEVALTVGELDRAWRGANLRSWSHQRLALAVLDALRGPLAPAEVVAAIASRAHWHGFKEEATFFDRRGSAVEVLADGCWAIAPGAEESLKRARAAVRDQIALPQRHAAVRNDPAVVEQRRAEWDALRAAHRAELARLSRALLVAFPPARPAAVALLDVGTRTISTFVGEQLAALPAHLAAYDLLGAIDVRGLLRALGIEPGERRLAELGPPQKTKQLNPRGRTLKLTTAMLVQASCGIGKPFGDPEKLAEYLQKGDETRLRRRLEADVKSLYALYEYGRLHGAVRLRRGTLDERIPAPWVHRDEPMLYHLKAAALAMNVPLEVVIGSAPGWEDPWSRVLRVHVAQDERRWLTWLVDDDGDPLDEAQVQRARLSVALH